MSGRISGRMMVALVVLFVTPFPGVARAQEAEVEVIIELVADPPGPYNGGESVIVDVWLHSQVSFDDLLHLIQFDFSESDPALALNPTLTFDYSSIPNDSGYQWRFPELPVPWTANFLSCVCPDAFLLLPGEGSLHIASIGLKLPTDDGTYRVEVLNGDAPDPSEGARLLVRGADLRAFTGEISGGALDLRVGPGIPTLSEWGMIALGLLVLVAGTVVIRTGKRYCSSAGVFGVLCLLAPCASSFAQDTEVEVIIELVPDPPGPYDGGESLTVDVWLHSPLSFDSYLWVVRLDFSASDGQLILDPTFTFDLSSSTSPQHFEVRPEMPIPWTANLSTYVCPECRLQLPAGGSLHVGSVGVDLPSEIGVYRLDVLNADDPDPTRGARIIESGGDWRAFTGNITGGALDLTVGPGIPTLSEWGTVAMTCLLLVLGARIIVRRNREMERTTAPSGMRNCRDIAPGLRLKGICASALCLGLPATLLAQPAP